MLHGPQTSGIEEEFCNSLRASELPFINTLTSGAKFQMYPSRSVRKQIGNQRLPHLLAACHLSPLSQLSSAGTNSDPECLLVSIMCIVSSWH